MGMSSTEVERCGYCGHLKRGEISPSSLIPEQCQCPNASDSVDPNIRLGSVPSSAFRRTSIIPSSSSDPQQTTSAGLVEIVSIREKHGYFRKSIPRMPLAIAIFLCMLNVILPGSGTFLSVFGVLCGCKTEHNCRRKSSLCTLLAAFLQLLTAIIVVGWIWSILWGITFVNLSVSKDTEEMAPSVML